TALIIHVQGHERAPQGSIKRVREAMAAAEKIAAAKVERDVETVFCLQAEVLRRDSLRRLSILEGRVLAARVFIASTCQPPSALVATVVGSLDGSLAGSNEFGAEAMFRGGATVAPTPAAEMLSPLDDPTVDLLFSPQEATALLRTSLPTEAELPGIKIVRARTAPLRGHCGRDVPLGGNTHRGLRLPVALDEEMRFRHTYIVGQTGTGKSTLMLNMILHDIRHGRGVAVLDPHGTLIEEILLHYPKERSEDLSIVDVTDVERPVGFNILRINERDALAYRLARDLVIDDLHSYLERSYDINMLGPVFETHFRGMMSLLLGLEPQEGKMIPNLLVFRSLYTNAKLRDLLISRLQGQDLMIEDFINEVTSACGEHSLRNIATYITGKFNRFVSDMTLRNITCQNSILDLSDVVDNGRVLLFYLGKGRFGDQAAGLLASQIVSRLRYAVMKRGASVGVRPFYLYADEFQLFADNRFAELLAEARKFKLSLTLAHQYLDQLTTPVLQGVLGNVGTTISFRVGAPDASRLEWLFNPTFSARDLISLDNHKAYARSFGTLGSMPFSIETEPPPRGGDRKRAAALRELARLKYGRDRKTVEAEIRRTFDAYNKASA
ncbi:MAG: DUF87 domain-containing protein, partial [Acidobacteria bacterium]|nr:DUF87 domain-containing protein [Acidobacteriota bacterium]